MQCMASLPARPTPACVTRMRPGGTIGVDPAWSTTGLVYVTAKDLGSAGWAASPRRFATWRTSRSLWFVPPGKAARKLAGLGAGVYDPVWSSDGRLLIVLRGTDLELVTPTHPPRRRTRVWRHARPLPDGIRWLSGRVGGPRLVRRHELTAGLRSASLDGR